MHMGDTAKRLERVRERSCSGVKRVGVERLGASGVPTGGRCAGVT